MHPPFPKPETCFIKKYYSFPLSLPASSAHTSHPISSPSKPSKSSSNLLFFIIFLKIPNFTPPIS